MSSRSAPLTVGRQDVSSSLLVRAVGSARPEPPVALADRQWWGTRIARWDATFGGPQPDSLLVLVWSRTGSRGLSWVGRVRSDARSDQRMQATGSPGLVGAAGVRWDRWPGACSSSPAGPARHWWCTLDHSIS